MPEPPDPHGTRDSTGRKPDARREQELGEGYDGLCSAEIRGKRCGKPGRLHSGPGPFSFICCDEHTPDGFIHFGKFVIAVILLLAGVSALLWWLL